MKNQGISCEELTKFCDAFVNRNEFEEGDVVKTTKDCLKSCGEKFFGVIKRRKRLPTETIIEMMCQPGGCGDGSDYVAEIETPEGEIHKLNLSWLTFPTKKELARWIEEYPFIKSAVEAKTDGVKVLSSG